jgi:hypothetical protein
MTPKIKDKNVIINIVNHKFDKPLKSIILKNASDYRGKALAYSTPILG